MKRIKYLLVVIVILAMTASLIACGNTTPEKVTVTFDTDGGSAIAAVEITKGKTLKEPIAPVKEGFTFDGWYTDSEFTVKYDFSQKVIEDITLYAKWVETTSIEEPKGLTFEEIEQLAKSFTSADIRFNIHSKNNPAELTNLVEFVNLYFGLRDNSWGFIEYDPFGNDYFSSPSNWSTAINTGYIMFMYEGKHFHYIPHRPDRIGMCEENLFTERKDIFFEWIIEPLVTAIENLKEHFVQESYGFYTLDREYYSAFAEAYNDFTIPDQIHWRIYEVFNSMNFDDIHLVITEEEFTLHFDNDNRSYISFYNFNTTDSLISDEDWTEIERWLADNQETGMQGDLYNA